MVKKLLKLTATFSGVLYQFWWQRFFAQIAQINRDNWFFYSQVFEKLIVFAKIDNDFQLLVIFAKQPILECLTGFWLRLSDRLIGLLDRFVSFVFTFILWVKPKLLKKLSITAQKKKFSIEYFFSKFD